MNEPIHPLQAMINGMSADLQKKRAKTQLTLGGLIKTLQIFKAARPDRKVVDIGKPISYRGYYCDLAFEPEKQIPVSEALKVAKGCMGAVFEGYKGGDFQMGENTPLWSACYGDTGLRIMGLNADADVITLVLAPDENE